jgi:pilus assembly protein Flp/PilA
MKKFARTARSFLTAEDGPAAVEYAIMLAMIILVCFAAVMSVGTQTSSIFQKAANSLP